MRLKTYKTTYKTSYKTTYKTQTVLKDLEDILYTDTDNLTSDR